jgi:hypothetical protein
MRRLAVLALFAVAAVACHSDPIGPDPTGSGGASASGSDASSTTDVSTSSTGTGGSGPKQGFESGSRLKARVVTGTDGSETRIGFFDSERMENCAFRAAVDGTTRCMPTDSVVFGGVYFADSNCNVHLAQSTCGLPQYIYESTGGACSAPRIFAVNSAPYTGQVFISNGATCVPVGVTGSFYLESVEISPTEFVQGTETKLP